MNEILVKEYKWGWAIDIPCMKCGIRECPGNYLSVVSKVGYGTPYPDDCNNVKEAIDNCQEMSKMWSMYCNNPNPIS